MKRNPAPKTPSTAWPASSVELVPVTALVPYARNARTHSDEQLAQLMASIREFGFTQPILRDDAGLVIAGHGRLAAAQRLGLAEVPVVTARGWTEAKKRACVIADNKLTLNAGWDYEMLSLELSDLQGLDIDMGLLAFSEDELNDLLYVGRESEGLSAASEVTDPRSNGHSIHLNVEEAAQWREALDHVQADEPDLTEAQAVLWLARRYRFTEKAA
jgi:ParB-like chromosome segregation protein Spo0J